MFCPVRSSGGETITLVMVGRQVVGKSECSGKATEITGIQEKEREILWGANSGCVLRGQNEGKVWVVEGGIVLSCKNCRGEGVLLGSIEGGGGGG